MARDKTKFKIAVLGVGGVGGYLGGRLTARFPDSQTIETVLAARGENEKAIRARGLKLVSTFAGEQTVKPRLAPMEEIGDADLILLCTKEYDLEETVSALKNHIGEQAAILPLLNGVDTAERIARLLPEHDIWPGCIYIVSRLKAPGVVEETGNICLIHFGGERGRTEKMEFVEAVFQEAGIDARLSDDITTRIWEKFVFLSPLAATTTYRNKRTREVLEDPESKKLLDELLAEVKSLAAALEIGISEEAVQEKLDKLNTLPPEATSSMHTDFSGGKRAEIESLVGYVVREAKKSNVAVPVYEKVYRELKEKQKASAGG